MTRSYENEEEQVLWRLLHSGDKSARDWLISEYLPFARIIAAKLYARRRHDEIEFEEYLQLATLGLMESIDRFNPVLEVKFKTFASRRMIGAILDGVERYSEKQQQIAFRQRVEAERIESLREEEGSGKIESEQIFKYLADVGVGIALGILLDGSGMIDFGADTSIAPHYDQLELKQLQRRIRKLVDSLPERERQLIKYHYLQNCPLQEIAERWQVTKGRVSHIHRRALELLRNELNSVPGRDIAW